VKERKTIKKKLISFIFFKIKHSIKQIKKKNRKDNLKEINQ